MKLDIYAGMLRDLSRIVKIPEEITKGGEDAISVYITEIKEDLYLEMCDNILISVEIEAEEEE